MALDGISSRLVSLPTLPVTGTAAPSGTSGGGFVDSLSKALSSLQSQHATTDALAEAGLTGDLTNVHDYMIAATQAQLATDLTVAVRNRALEAFTSIMTMPV
ncbi:MAG: flagellar hook-basal body complex protein FliE [Acidimicrobiales bacterium]